ncbi:MAG TPA: adenylate kinase [Thermomicrobiales bacterium]|nr:adenylate kinase [Thermomicrobiales bacterium]
MHVILMGAQGSGKGTQATRLCPVLKLEKIATGDLFRGEIASGSPLGVELKAVLDRGDLVPDDLTNAIVHGRIQSLVHRRDAGEDVQGALFDGFPRTAAQASALDGILRDFHDEVSLVVEIDVPRDILIERLAGRRVCTTCGAVYHIEANPATVPEVCDKCGGTLVQRDDDRPKAIERRLSLYDLQTAPLLDYYQAQGKLRRVDGNRGIDEVEQSILAIVNALPVSSGRS